MKKHLFIAPITLILTGCANLTQLQTSYPDDLYYIPGEQTNIQNPAPDINNNNNLSPKQQQNRLDMVYSDLPESDTLASNNPEDSNQYQNRQFDMDDYYDYEYAARLRRFHSPYYGYDYYDGFYTNLYWYSYNPFDFGWSIYLGYNWWYPSSYYSWYWPYSFYSPSMAYWYGYQNGFYDGYWYRNYYDIYYYNSYDGTNNLAYGPRLTYSTNGTSSGNHTRGTRDSFVKSYEDQVIMNHRVNPSSNTLSNPNSGRTRNTVNVGTGTNALQNDGNLNQTGYSRNRVNISQTEKNTNLSPDNNNDNNNRTRNLSNSFPDAKNQPVTTSPNVGNDNNSGNNYRPSYSIPRSPNRPIYNNSSNDRPVNNNVNNNQNNNQSRSHNNNVINNNSNNNNRSSYHSPSTPNRSYNSNTRSSSTPKSSGTSSGTSPQRKR